MLFIQTGPLCIHRGTNSLSANDMLWAGQLCVTVSVAEKMMERLLVAETEGVGDEAREHGDVVVSFFKF